MSLVDAPSSTPQPPAISPEAVAGTSAAIDQETPVTVGKVVEPAPNGKTPTPLPRPRPEQSPSETSASMAPSGGPQATVAAAAGDPPATQRPAPDSASALETPGSAAAATPAASSTSPAAAATVLSPLPAAAEATGNDGSSTGPLDEMSALKEVLPTKATAATAGEASAATTAEGAESADEEEAASTNSLKDDPGTPEECNLFVGDLARNLTEEKLEKAFEKFGTVMSVSIKRDRATGKNLGYGFVKLSSHQEARAAKEGMQDVDLGGRRVRVGWAQKNTSLYVGGLEGVAVTTDMLVREFARFGPVDKELTSIKPGAKGAFVKYRYRLHAETAKKELHDRPAFGGLCTSVQIEWNSVESSGQGSETAGPERPARDRSTGGGGGREGGRGGRSFTGSGGGHFRHRSETSGNTVQVQFEGEQSRVSAVNEGMIKKLFSKWEPLVDVVIPAGRFNGVSPGKSQLPRCWGFVHFPPTPEGELAAADAVKSLDGTTFSELKVHCTMSRSTSSGGGGSSRRQGGAGGGGRSRRHSVGSGGGGENNRAMGHGHGFGGRPARSSLDGPGAPQGRGGSWGGNAGMNRNNMQMQHNRHPHHGPPGGQHAHFLGHMQHPHHLQPSHAHHQHGGPLQQAPQQHQMYAAAGYQPTAAGSPAFAAGQYPVLGAAAVLPAGPEGAPAGSGGAAGGGGGADMMLSPYGMTPYQYPIPYQGVPYAPAQQGYPMGYQQMYPGFPYPNTAMPQGQQQVHGAGGQAGPQQQQQLGGVPQQTGPPPGPQGGAGAQQAKSAVAVQRQQQHMGMQQHAMMMAGQGQPNPAGGGGGGLNVGVSAYIPQQLYQLQQQQMAPGAGGESDPNLGGGGGAKHGGIP